MSGSTPTQRDPKRDPQQFNSQQADPQHLQLHPKPANLRWVDLRYTTINRQTHQTYGETHSEPTHSLTVDLIACLEAVPEAVSETVLVSSLLGNSLRSKLSTCPWAVDLVDLPAMGLMDLPTMSQVQWICLPKVLPLISLICLLWVR